MAKLGLFLCFFLLLSCEMINSGKVSQDEIVREEMEGINWSEVDRYPLFEACDETASVQEQKQCFQSEFVKHFYSTLSSRKLVVRRHLDDTIKVHLLVDARGEISIVSVDQSQRVADNLPALDALLELTVDGLPKVYPAIKRDIPVSTRVVLPVVLKVN